MSGGRCWSSIVATGEERAALALGPDAEWLVGCVLGEGHPGAHASDGGQAHHGRRRWLVWGDFARGAQMLRDEDPCPIVEPGGTGCLYYLGHSGPHRFRQVDEIVPVGSPPLIPQPAPPVPSAPPVPPAPPMPSPPPMFVDPGLPPTQPWQAPSAFDLDPEPPTEPFPAVPAPPGWPESVDAPVPSTSAMDQLFADLPSLAPEDAPIVEPTSVWTVPEAPAWTTPENVEVVDVVPEAEVPLVDAADLVDETTVDAAAVVEPEPEPEIEPEVEEETAAPDEVVDESVVESGPARFEPVVDEPAGPDHRPAAVDNEYEPSLGDDAPGGATRLVYRDDPSASSMEVRPTSDDVLTTSMLTVISSAEDPLRIGVPTELRPLSGPARTDGPVVEQLSGSDVRAMTDAVRDAADRLRANPGADDTHAISEALRDMASSLARLADRFGK